MSPIGSTSKPWSISSCIASVYGNTSVLRGYTSGVKGCCTYP